MVQGCTNWKFMLQRWQLALTNDNYQLRDGLVKSESSLTLTARQTENWQLYYDTTESSFNCDCEMCWVSIKTRSGGACAHFR